MRNTSNAALIAFTAHLLRVDAFANKRVSSKRKHCRVGNSGSGIRPTCTRGVKPPLFFLDSDSEAVVTDCDPPQENEASDSLIVKHHEDVLVYKTEEAASFSLLRPYLFNELDLRHLFQKEKKLKSSGSSSSNEDAACESSLYDDLREVEVGHWKASSHTGSSSHSSVCRNSSPFFFCQHKHSSRQPRLTTALPPWLSLLDPSSAPLRLSSLRRDLAPHLSPKQISTVIQAICVAAKNDQQLAGAADFCSLLVNSLEMSDVTALIGSAFHFCSLVQVRQKESQSDVYATDSTTTGNGYCGNPDTKYLCALAGSGIESFSPHVMKIALDAARLKSIEAVAATMKVNTSSGNSSNLRSLLLSVNEEGDWRALAIRSAACLYRLKGLMKWREDNACENDVGKRKRTREESCIGHEALHIYAPLAARLGMFRLKTELEDAAFRTLYPNSHSMVSALCDTADVERGMKSVLSDISNQMKRMVQEDLYFMEHIQNVSITARLKEPYSIWRKMVKMSKRGDKKLDDISILDIPDAVALRVVFSARKLTEDESDAITQRREEALCYYILDLCKETWPDEMSSSRFKDYVSHPKENGYQSLHYSSSKRWRGKEWPFEVQIRSNLMHRVAEYGVAAHWSYKHFGIDAPSNLLSTGNTKRTLDKSSESYLRSVQKYTSPKASHNYVTPEAEPLEPMYIDDEIRRDRKREREERLAPYLEALFGAQMDMAREHVYIFVSHSDDRENCNQDDSLSQSMRGTVLSLPRGSCVLDAIRAAENWSMTPACNRVSRVVLRNGRRSISQTERLDNGDVISIMLGSEELDEARNSDLIKQLFSVV